VLLKRALNICCNKRDEGITFIDDVLTLAQLRDSNIRYESLITAPIVELK
jgi:hypothetical protein